MTAPSAGSVTTDYSSITKTRYRATGQEKRLLGYERPLYTKIPRKGNLTGHTISTPISYSPHRGHAKGEGGLVLLENTTHSPVGPSKYTAWNQTLELEYDQAWFSNVTLKKLGNDEASFLRVFDVEIKQTYARFGESVAHSLFRDGSGVFGTVASASLTSGNGTITLTSRGDCMFFKVGQKINAINPASPATVLGGTYDTSYFEVTKRNVQAATLEVVRVGTNAIDGTTTGYLLSPYSYYSQNGANRIRGLSAICPLVAPTTGDNFYGVDRSVDVNTLAGWRFDGPSSTHVEDQIIEMVTYMNTSGVGDELVAYANPDRVKEVLQRAQGRMQYETEMIDAGEFSYGLRYVRVVTQKGDVKLYPEPYCPMDRWFGLNNMAISLGTLGDEPELINTQGQTHFRRPAADGFGLEFRLLAQVLPDMPSDIVTGPLA